MSKQGNPPWNKFEKNKLYMSVLIERGLTKDGRSESVELINLLVKFVTSSMRLH